VDMKIVDADSTFDRLGGLAGRFPGFVAKPHETGAGQRYFIEPGVVLLARPEFNRGPLGAFLDGFPSELGFNDFMQDEPIRDQAGTELIKTAGQLCYMSFGTNRTKNADAQKYIDNILKSGHGSVLEHAQYSFLIWGVGRDFTHELVRHRTGVAFSQVSQRYVDGQVLRFVERPEYQEDNELHSDFANRMRLTVMAYDRTAQALIKRQSEGDAALSGEKKTELRKRVNQAARSLLPNETEAPIVFSGNIRALRHVVEMRSSNAADVPIRMVTTRIFLAMRHIEPVLFNDYKLYELPDGTNAVATEWRKV